MYASCAGTLLLVKALPFAAIHLVRVCVSKSTNADGPSIFRSPSVQKDFLRYPDAITRHGEHVFRSIISTSSKPSPTAIRRPPRISRATSSTVPSESGNVDIHEAAAGRIRLALTKCMLRVAGIGGKCPESGPQLNFVILIFRQAWGFQDPLIPGKGNWFHCRKFIRSRPWRFPKTDSLPRANPPSD